MSLKSRSLISIFSRLLIAFLALQVLFSNCSPVQPVIPPSQNLPSTKSSEDNGGGYVGLRAKMPVAAAPGDRFNIVVSGGQAPYRISTDSAYAEVVRADGAEAVVQIKENAPLGEKIRFKIMDSNSDSIESDVTIVYLNRPNGVTTSPSGETVYVYDEALDSIVAFNSSTGVRSLVSSPRIGKGAPILAGEGLIINGVGTHLYLVDKAQSQQGEIEAGLAAVVEIEIRTGNRRIVSGSGVGAGPRFRSPSNLALQTSQNTLYVTDGSRLMRVNLITGERSIIAQSVGSERNLDFVYLRAVVLNKEETFAYVVDSHRATVVKVRLVDGQRSLVSAGRAGVGAPRGQGPDFFTPKHIILDEVSGKILVLNEKGADPLIEVDLDSGDRTSIFSLSKSNLINPSHMIRFENQLYITGLHGLHIYSGESKPTVDIDSLLGLSETISADIKGLVVRDDRLLFLNNKSIGEFDLTTNKLSQISFTQDLYYSDFVMSPDGDNIFILESSLQRIVRFNLLNNSAEILVPQSSDISSVEKLTNAMAIEADFNQNKIYVLTSTSLISVDLATGKRTLVSKDNVLGHGPGFQFARAFALDEFKNKAYVVNLTGQNLMAVDLSTGSREIVTDIGRGVGPKFLNPQAVVLSSDKSYAYVADDKLLTILKVDLLTGDTVTISSKVKGDGPMFSRIQDMAIDAGGTTVYVSDPLLRAIFAVDLKTGHRRLVVK